MVEIERSQREKEHVTHGTPTQSVFVQLTQHSRRSKQKHKSSGRMKRGKQLGWCVGVLVRCIILALEKYPPDNMILGRSVFRVNHSRFNIHIRIVFVVQRSL